MNVRKYWEKSKEVKLDKAWGIFNEARYETKVDTCTESNAPFLNDKFGISMYVI